jgi:hypothetical protein
MRARTDLWEPRVGNRPGPPGGEIFGSFPCDLNASPLIQHPISPVRQKIPVETVLQERVPWVDMCNVARYNIEK